MSKSSLDLIAGRNPVHEALARGDASFEKILIQQGRTSQPLATIQHLARAKRIQVQYVPASKLDHLTGGRWHQGVVAVIAPISYADVDDMLYAIASDPDVVRAQKPRLLMLDQIQDPHNFGAILRSAVAFGVAGVIIPDRNMAPLSAATIKASAGTALRIPIARVTNLRNTILGLKERGYWVVGTAGQAKTTIQAMDWDRPLALVIGSEGKGLREGIQKLCDYLVSIPISGPAESLNASVATGILLFISQLSKD